MSSKSHDLGEETHIEDVGLSPERQQYIISRHGTLDLDPLPSDDPADPLNWNPWKKHTTLFLVSFHAMMTTFISASINPAYESIAEELSISIQTASYLTAVNILFLGIAPFFWKPFSRCYGRRPVFILSTGLSCIANIGCAVSHSYGSMMVCRILVAVFICPPLSIGPGVVTELFFAHERGRKMGIWSLMTTLGPPSGPFFMGFVAYHVNWRWIYWISAITNIVQCVLYIFFGPETRYVGRHSGSPRLGQYFYFRRIDPKPMAWSEFYNPLLLARHVNILLPTISFAIVFGFASVTLAVEIPLLFGSRFHFNGQQLGLQYLALMIGSVLGEQAGGPLSDFFMAHLRKQAEPGHRSAPESRLWISYFGYATTIAGLCVFAIQLEHAEAEWDVSPLVGIAIAAFGNQMITTITITYSIDCHEGQSASIGVFFGLFRAVWGFICPLFAPQMFTGLGLYGSAGLMTGLVVVVGVLPIVAVHVYGFRTGTRTK
ncbi:hypothetical protein FE257_001327 [Aspergillus nanangensis]|uniref:Major facilitator superfamily (MFS) profile domain-containing protein n=1 Tax=Aspergillus nanangensis TaxID=2582783 RepID=A0AAD4GQT2_ASPNN|nr:hypothetical protein FE257_001327 [Aspergillus nanangensis]